MILRVPTPGIGTYESRGIPTIEIAPLAGFTPTMWSESPRVASGDSPGRASLPITRMKNGPVDASPGEAAALRTFACRSRSDGTRLRTSYDEICQRSSSRRSVYEPVCCTGSSTPSPIAVPRKRTDATAMNGRRPTRNRTPIVEVPGRTESIPRARPPSVSTARSRWTRGRVRSEKRRSSVGNRPSSHASGSTNPVEYISVITRVTAWAAGRSRARPNALSGYPLALDATEIEREPMNGRGRRRGRGTGRGGARLAPQWRPCTPSATMPQPRGGAPRRSGMPFAFGS